MRERPGDRSRAEVSRRRTHRSRSISTDRLRSRGHAHYSPPSTPCPLPAHGHRDTSRNLRSSPGSVGSNRYTTEAPRGTTGSTRSPTTSSGSHMPMTNRIGTGPGPVTASGHGIPHVAPRTARGRESIFTGLGTVTTANTRPRPHTPLRCPAPRRTIWPSPPTGTTGMRNSIGSMPHRGQTGTAATPKPRLRPGNTPTAPAVGPPGTGFPHAGFLGLHLVGT